ncbi:MAG: T9SS type A sorting domain-containing protein [Saprospiraceae bacterium]|nr:T9SS type A sorting domain-containing protein [Saprospiraceae bacterium]
MHRFLLVFGLCIMASLVSAQQITEVKTFHFDSSNKKDTVINFPDMETEKIIMRYTMRCKDGLVSTGTDRNKGCGEWDYSCNTFVTDSSRLDSFLAKAPSHIISNFSGNLFNYVNNPTYSYIQYELKPVTITTTQTETRQVVGSGENTLGLGGSGKNNGRMFFLYRKEDIGAFGGKITGIEFQVKSGNGELKLMKVRMKETDLTTVDNETVIASAGQEVFFDHVNLPASGTLHLQFHDDFAWSGSKNILVEVSYVADEAFAAIESHSAPFASSALSTGADRYLKIDGSAILNIPANEANSITEEITIAFWVRGRADILPANTAAMEATDEAGNRQIMIHLPWSNANVFWDCGNNGSGYDRINKLATAAEYEGKWQYWAFTKNAKTGTMKIYLNGKLWHTGTGMTKPIHITKLSFGGSLNMDLSFPGDMDDLTVWNKELSEAELASRMRSRVSPADPLYDNLVYQYNFNEENALEAADDSKISTSGVFNAIPFSAAFIASQKFKQYQFGTERPKLILVRGNYSRQVGSEIYLDSFPNQGNVLRTFYVENNNLKEGDKKIIWASGETFIYDEAEKILESIFIEEDSTIFIEDLEYYNRRPMKYELVSFVTPYGIGLNFGFGGKSWDFDVSDFAPILKGRKRLTMEFGGQNQEEMDIRFLYYQGTAPRKVKDIRQVWPVNSVGYASLLNNGSFEQRNIQFQQGTASAKLRTAITGHGQEGEFIPQTHYLNVNGGTNEWAWQVWKECAANPVYPQGGTWIYDRAGWCPGMPTDLREYDLTSFVSGNNITLDYGVNTAQGDSRYIINCQLVEYEAAAFQNDAAVERIISPSLGDAYARVNPICLQPEVEIKNTGSATLLSLTIRYGVTGGQMKTYQWTGNLKFMEKARVTLPVLDPNQWLEAGEFVVEVVDPNGQADAYAQNNTATSSFKKAPKFKSDVIIQMRTNGASNETSWVLTDADGNVIRQRKGGLQPNTEYTDTLKNLGGCYFLKISDTGDDGISFWNNADGTGFLGIRSVGEATQQFQGDFGKEINFQFLAGDIISDITEITAAEAMVVYPNPNNGQSTLEIQGINQPLSVLLTDIYGKVLLSEKRESRPHHSINLDMADYTLGIYFVHVLYGTNHKTMKLIRM